jgi:hypothetical protein
LPPTCNRHACAMRLARANLFSYFFITSNPYGEAAGQRSYKVVCFQLISLCALVYQHGTAENST